MRPWNKVGRGFDVQAGKNPLRRAPPRPEFRCQDYLDAVEERYKQSILTDYERSLKCRVDDRRLPVCSFVYLLLSIILLSRTSAFHANKRVHNSKLRAVS